MGRYTRSSLREFERRYSQLDKFQWIVMGSLEINASVVRDSRVIETSLLLITKIWIIMRVLL